LNVTKTVLSWIHEFENKRIVELQGEFRVLFGVKGVAGGNTTSLKLSRQLFGKKKCRNKLQGHRCGKGSQIAARYLDKAI